MQVPNASSKKRFKSLLKEVEEAQGSVILFIDEIHMVLGAGSMDGMLPFCKPMLARGQLHCIEAITLKEYQKLAEEDATF